MPRLDRSSLTSASFPVVSRVPTRIGDVDMLRHINNVAAMAILQEGRSDLLRQAHAELPGGPDLRPVVAGITVEFAEEMHWPDPVDTFSGILSIGRRSLTIGQIMRQGAHDAVYAEVAMVILGMPGAGDISDAARQAYGRFMITGIR